MKKPITLIFLVAFILTGCKNKDNVSDKNNIQQPIDTSASTESISKDLQNKQVIRDKHYFKPNYSLLTGKLTKEVFYGAPGYGKDPDKDKKEQIYFLNLDRPFDISTFQRAGKPVFEDIDSVNKIQLISSSDFNDKILESSVNRDVVVKGMLIRNKGEHKPSEAAMELIGIH